MHTPTPHRFECLDGVQRTVMQPELENVINCTTQGGRAVWFFLFQLKVPHTINVFPFFSFDIFSTLWYNSGSGPYKAVVLVSVWHAIAPWNQSLSAASQSFWCPLVQCMIMQTRLFTLDNNQYLGVLWDWYESERQQAALPCEVGSRGVEQQAGLWAPDKRWIIDIQPQG